MNEKLEATKRALVAYARERGYWPPYKEWDAHAKAHGFYTFMGMYQYERKSWEQYRKEFGFPERRKRFTEQECIEALKIAADEFGPWVTGPEYRQWQKRCRPDLPTYAQIQRACGSWNQAKEKAGLPTVPSIGKTVTKEDIIEAMREAMEVLGPDFSEREYIEWAQKNGKPHAETIRNHFRSINAVRRLLNMRERLPTSESKYDEHSWKTHFMRFLMDALNIYRYEAWAKENNGLSMKVIRKYAGGYEQALLTMLPLYMENIRDGKKRRR